MGTQERRDLAIRLLSQGYTTSAVNFRLQDAGHNPYPEVKLIQIRQQYAPAIDDLREREEIEIRARGLARRGERIRRLSKLAEAIEPRLFISDSEPANDSESPGGVPSEVNVKLAGEYRKVIQAIGQEADPLGITEALDPNDPWTQLIVLLTKSGSDRQLPSSLRSLTNSERSPRLTNSQFLPAEQERSSLLEESEQEKASSPQRSSLLESSGESSTG